jgi:hypothetical protein
MAPLSRAVFRFLLTPILAAALPFAAPLVPRVAPVGPAAGSGLAAQAMAPDSAAQNGYYRQPSIRGDYHTGPGSRHWKPFGATP